MVLHWIANPGPPGRLGSNPSPGVLFKMEHEKLQKEMKEAFEKAKKEMGFKASFEEIEKIFYINDYVLKEGFVSSRFDRAICHRVTETINSWAWFLHGIVVPNPNSMFNITESQYFDEKEKQHFNELMNKTAEMVSRNSLFVLNQDIAAEGKLVDDAIEFWNSEFNPELVKIMSKINKNWKEKIK